MVKSESKSDLKCLSSAALAIRDQFCPLTSEAVLFKILAISSQMHLNGEVGIKIGLMCPPLLGGRHEKLHMCIPLYCARLELFDFPACRICNNFT